MKLLSSMSEEEIKVLDFRRLNFLIKYESTINDLRKEKERVRLSKEYFKHCLELSDNNFDIAKRFFMESKYSVYADEVFEGLEKKWN